MSRNAYTRSSSHTVVEGICRGVGVGVAGGWW
jgi:hypothetical protein